MGFKDKNREKEYKHQWYLENHKELLEKAKQYRIDNHESVLLSNKLCYERRKDYVSSFEKERLRKIRYELMNVLGGTYCKNCGFNIYEALQFDHINGGGTKERELFRSGKAMYKFYLNNTELAKTKLQVLCANCNMIKRSHSGEVN